MRAHSPSRAYLLYYISWPLRAHTSCFNHPSMKHSTEVRPNIQHSFRPNVIIWHSAHLYLWRRVGRISKLPNLCTDIHKIYMRVRSVSRCYRPWNSRKIRCSLFTALRVMQTRYCDENSVRLSVYPSVCPSVCHTRVLWQNGRKICPDLYTIWKNI